MYVLPIGQLLNTDCAKDKKDKPNEHDRDLKVHVSRLDSEAGPSLGDMHPVVPYLYWVS